MGTAHIASWQWRTEGGARGHVAQTMDKKNKTQLPVVFLAVVSRTFLFMLDT